MKFFVDGPYTDDELTEMCPWFTINKLTYPCSCKEHTKKMSDGNKRTLILIDDSCQTHGCVKNVDLSDDIKYNK